MGRDLASQTLEQPKRRRKLSFSLILGELLLTLGALALLFAFYESYWTNLKSAQVQADVRADLDRQWEGDRINPRIKTTPELGTAFAKMYIPSFGSDFSFAIVHGTTDADLIAGPGHYVETQLPGEAGNFAVAGHRVGKGAPFNDLGKLETCTAIVVETQTEWITYRVLPIAEQGEQRLQAAESCMDPVQAQRVTNGDYAHLSGRYITSPTDIAVIGAKPGIEDHAPTPDMEAMMTLTTCHPQFSNAERMIVHAIKVEAHPKEDNYRPAALEEN